MRKFSYQSNPTGEKGREPKRTSFKKDYKNRSQGKYFQGYLFQSQSGPIQELWTPCNHRELRDKQEPARTPPDERTRKEPGNKSGEPWGDRAEQPKDIAWEDKSKEPQTADTLRLSRLYAAENPEKSNIQGFGLHLVKKRYQIPMGRYQPW